MSGALHPDRALRGLIRAGTKIMPGARQVTSDEINKIWEHAMRRKLAEREPDRRDFEGERDEHEA